MAAIPQPMHTTVARIYAMHAARVAAQTDRAYLGGSALGGPCERALWYGLRWATRRTVDGRIARLFDTGHREEERLLAELRAIGCEVVDRQADGQQWGVQTLGGHARGHLDAVVRGLDEAPTAWQLVDVKTISRKNFAVVQAKGMKLFEPKYWAQAMFYMGLAGLDRAQFFFVCKDDDSIHIERVRFDQVEFDRLIERARRVVFSDEPPLRLSEDPAWFECKFCDYQSTCHGTDVPGASCRSCAHITPTEGGEWRCEARGAARTLDEQRAGCGQHRFIPVLLSKFAEHVGGDAHAVEYRHRITGASIWNGDAPGYSSKEIAACADKAALGDPGVDALREDFAGEVVG